MKKHNPDLLRYLSSILLSCFLVLAIASKSYSQVPDREATLEYLNRLGADTVNFKLKGAQLKISYRGKKGKVVRIDQVVVTDLDTVATFESENNLVCMNYLSPSRVSVTPELVLQYTKRTSGRISIRSTEGASKAYIAALQHLVKIESIKMYKDEIVLPDL